MKYPDNCEPVALSAILLLSCAVVVLFPCCFLTLTIQLTTLKNLITTKKPLRTESLHKTVQDKLIYNRADSQQCSYSPEFSPQISKFQSPSLSLVLKYVFATLNSFEQDENVFTFHNYRCTVWTPKPLLCDLVWYHGASELFQKFCNLIEIHLLFYSKYNCKWKFEWRHYYFFWHYNLTFLPKKTFNSMLLHSCTLTTFVHLLVFSSTAEALQSLFGAFFLL